MDDTVHFGLVPHQSGARASPFDQAAGEEHIHIVVVKPEYWIDLVSHAIAHGGLLKDYGEG
jgi:hypothetical protein